MKSVRGRHRRMLDRLRRGQGSIDRLAEMPESGCENGELQGGLPANTLPHPALAQPEIIEHKPHAAIPEDVEVRDRRRADAWIVAKVDQSVSLVVHLEHPVAGLVANPPSPVRPYLGNRVVKCRPCDTWAARKINIGSLARTCVRSHNAIASVIKARTSRRLPRFPFLVAAGNWPLSCLATGRGLLLRGAAA